MERDKIKRTPAEWEKIIGIIVKVDYGWQESFGCFKPKAYCKPISRHEFHLRAQRSDIISK